MNNENPYFEHPQIKNGKKNPNKFTISQHVFPRSCIARFCDNEYKVQTKILHLEKVQKLSPTSDWFCANRVWDHQAETGLAWATENSYNKIANKIASGEINILTPEMNEAITQFYMLWLTRFEVRKNTPPHSYLIKSSSEFELSKDAQENLEINGYMFSKNSRIPSRMTAGVIVRLHAMLAVRCFEGAYWGILKSSDAEFIVPDNVSNISFLPVDPKTCLVMNNSGGDINYSEVSKINRELLNSAYKYYFAKNLENCPILRRTLQNW